MIEIKELSKTFKKPLKKDGFFGAIKSLFSFKYTLKTAVKNVSFNIDEGEIVGYIGANGAGKSTTIKMMCGILTPTSGEVLIDGMRPYDRKVRNKVLQNIGVVFGQRTQLWWDLPLKDTFNLLKEIYQIPDSEFEERFTLLREALGLDEFMQSPVRTLSLGQRMRADLAASFMHNPKVLFLDEPTIGLDIVVKKKLIETIKEINHRYNTTIILTTHDMKDIEALCSRVVIIDEGSVLYDGQIKDLRKQFGDVRKVIYYSDAPIDVEKKFGQDVTVEKLSDGQSAIVFDYQSVKIKDVLDFLVTDYSISDVKITDTGIEDVVKRIYENKTLS